MSSTEIYDRTVYPACVKRNLWPSLLGLYLTLAALHSQLSLSGLVDGFSNNRSNLLTRPNGLATKQHAGRQFRSSPDSSAASSQGSLPESSGGIKVRTCDPITVKLCQDVGYKSTAMPNLVGHEDQNEAEIVINTFTPLLQFKCSNRLNFFLCSVYVPMCNEMVSKPIGPCRPLCEGVRSRCEPVLQKFGFTWPQALSCEKFPERNDFDVGMCMPGEPDESDNMGRDARKLIEALRNKTKSPLMIGKEADLKKNTFFNRKNFPQKVDKNVGLVRPDKTPASDWSWGVTSCKELKRKENYIYVNRSSSCLLLCERNGSYFGPMTSLFNRQDKDFAEIWMIVWSIACFIGAFFVVLCYFVEPSRFAYPDKCVIFMAVSCQLYSVAYLVRITVGRGQVACEQDVVSSKYTMIEEGLDNTACTIVFLLTYYFGGTTVLWWLSLTISWLMSAKGTAEERIQIRSTYFHLLSWVVPAIQMIVILITRKVGADELTGMCSVAKPSSPIFLWLVILPLIIYLSLGCLLLLCGFCAVFKRSDGASGDRSSTNRSENMQLRGGGATCSLNPNSRSESNLIRTGIFAVLYCIPAICLVACNFYEKFNLSRWHSATSALNEKPHNEIFMLKILMSLVTGILTFFWVCSKNTFLSWSLCLQRVCFRQDKRHRVPYTGASYTPYHHGNNPNSAAMVTCLSNDHRNKYLMQQHQPPSMQMVHVKTPGRSVNSRELAHV